MGIKASRVEIGAGVVKKRENKERSDGVKSKEEEEEQVRKEKREGDGKKNEEDRKKEVT